MTAEHELEHHPFAPILPENATVVMMGTFPPTNEKRCMQFHYPNFQNDMWRIMGLVFYQNADHFRVGEEKRFDPVRIEAFLREKGIALCSSAQTAIRLKGNASDKDLKIVEPVDMPKLLKTLPHVKWIFTTGGLATDTLFDSKRPLFLYRLPSTSRAYPLSLAKKVEAYKQFFIRAGLLTDEV